MRKWRRRKRRVRKWRSRRRSKRSRRKVRRRRWSRRKGSRRRKWPLRASEMSPPHELRTSPVQRETLLLPINKAFPNGFLSPKSPASTSST